jgi:hypothetical protein
MTIGNISMRKTIALLTVAGIAGLASFSASADTVVLPSPNSMNWGAQFLGSPSGNMQTVPPSGFGNNYSLSVPGQYRFSDGFGNQTTALTGTSSPVGSYAFQDTYEFSVSQAASGDALTVSLNLDLGSGPTFDISNLQFRLYEVAAGTAPGLLIPGTAKVITAWKGTSGPSSGTPINANFSGIQAGMYFLDVAGTADGSSGGTYLGQLNLAPVPLPAALPLLLSGLGLLGGLRRRRA